MHVPKTGLKQQQCIGVVGEALLNMQNGHPVTPEQYQLLNYLLHPILEGKHPNKIPGGRREGRPRKIMHDALAMSVQGKRRKSTKDAATVKVAQETGTSEDTVRGRYERSNKKAMDSHADTARRLKAMTRVWEHKKNSR